MDDIIGELQKFLSTDEGKKTAEALNEMLNAEEHEGKGVEQPCGVDLSSVMELLQTPREKSDSAALISALLPFLSDGRQKKAQRAVKILGAISLLPVLQKSGILSSLL